MSAPVPILEADSGNQSDRSSRQNSVTGKDNGSDQVSVDVPATPVTPKEEALPLATGTARPPAAAFGDYLLVLFGLRKKSLNHDPEEIATQSSVFDTAQGVHYLPTPAYEGYAAFEPSLRWTWAEDKRVLRKVDLKILSVAMLLFFSLNINRSNLTRATADGFLKDLKLTQADYNLGNTLYRLCFLFAELPHQLVSKRVGPDIWLPTSLAVASIIAAAQFWLSGRASFLATRCLLAFWQGGFIPDAILYLSYFYTKNELPLRLAAFWVMNTFTGTVSSFMAAGILEMRGINGLAGWRYLFLIEGLLCLGIALGSFFLLPASPSQTKTRWHPKGYFTDREVKIIVNKTLRDDPTKSSMHNREALSLKQLWRAVANKHMWPLYLIGLMFGIPGYPIANYFQLSMRQLGFSTLEANLLSVPNQVLTMIFLVAVTIISELVDSRTWVSMIENIWFLPNFIALVAVGGSISSWGYFAVSTVLLSYPYVHAIQVAWTSRNSGSVEVRTVSASLYNMAVQLSGIIGANLYQASDAPLYRKANSAIIAIILFNLLIMYPGTAWYYRRTNARREATWSQMSSEDRTRYLETTPDKGNERLDFRFAY